ALLSRHPMEDVQRGLPPAEGDDQARFISALISLPKRAVRVASAYMPNGNPIGTDKFAYKLAWLSRLEAWATGQLDAEGELVIAGDFNIIPAPIDAKNADEWLDDALFQPE